jgi:O-succinylbenzoic acid--CoA ligase
MTLSIFAAARDCPDEPFLIYDEVVLSFREVAALAAWALGWLLEQGIEPSGDLRRPVAVVPTSDAPAIGMLLALIGAGIPFVILHPRWTEAERQRFAARCDVQRVIDSSWQVGSVATLEPPLEPESTIADDERPLAVVPTSGSSAEPRGVVLSRRAFVAAARASAANLGFTPQDRWLLQLPLAHVSGLSILIRCLLARRPVVVADSSLRVPAVFVEYIERKRITLLSLVPTLLSELVAHKPAYRAPSSVRAVLVGGATASPALLRRAVELGWPVLATYGLTEACSQVCTQRLGTTDPEAQGVGPPLPGIEVRIADSKIQVRGPTLLSGYLPKMSAPVLLEDGWFETGDVGRLCERGRLWVLGRSDDVIISGGENVHPAEVEAVLEAHPSIRRACVFGVPDAVWGQNVAAAVVVAPSATVSAGELKALFVQQLASFKRPRAIAYLVDLPLLPNGKVDRGRTRDIAAEYLESIA